MKITATIRLHWLVNLPLNGRSPRGQRFALPARFDHQGEDWTKNAWSLIVDVEGIPNTEGWQTANARFLSDDAPAEWLAVGRRFTLAEGNLAVAEAEITAIHNEA